MAFISEIIQQHPDAGYWHQQYPWFPIGQLVNAANSTDTPAFTESARRTAVFFNNIPRLHWLLYQQEADVAALRASVYPETTLPPTKTQNTSAETGIIIIESGNSDESFDQTSEIAEPQKVVDDIVIPDESASAIVDTTNVIKTEPNKVAQSFTPEINPKETAEVVIQPRADDHHPVQTVADAPTTHLNTENTFFDPALVTTWDAEETEDVEPEEPELMPLSTSMLSESLARAADSYKNAPLNDDAMVFKTAYQHTIDYFASQGIKLDSEPAKDDRFGRQLKTFTSWLRQMKPLPDTPLPEADPLVESQAEHSLQKGEVVTESMADVLLKQGKIMHALAVLEKLRLLHPQKSHYFAARIEQIKHA